jgi:hypothetical protein
VDESFHDFYRSRKHYIPDPEGDIKLFIARQEELKVHKYDTNRPEAKKEQPGHDCYEVGRVNIMEKRYLEQLGVERNQYYGLRSTLESTQYKDKPLDEVLKQMSLEHLEANNQGADIDFIIEALTGETGGQRESAEMDEDNLFFENDEPEMDKEGEKAYEGVRHMLGDGWGI